MENIALKSFIGWSGDISREVALKLHDWLGQFFHNIEPWHSELNIPKGTDWADRLKENLKESDLILVCVTSENIRSPWLNFEAGFVASSEPVKRVAPLLFGINKNDLKGPLTRFQLTEVDDEQDVKKLMSDINDMLVTKGIPGIRSEHFDSNFNLFWPNLKDFLEGLISKLPDLEDGEFPVVNDTASRLISSHSGVAESLRQNPEPVYLYDARKFGQGHNRVEFRVDIVDFEEYAELRRVVEVEAFSRLTSFDSFLHNRNEDQLDIKELLRYYDLNSGDPVRRPILRKTRYINNNITSVTQEFQGGRTIGDQDADSTNEKRLYVVFAIEDPLDPGEQFEYELIEKVAPGVYSATTKDYISWAITRPTRQLSLRARLPKGFTFGPTKVQVRRTETTSNYPTDLFHAKETERLMDQEYIQQSEDNRVELCLDIPYPIWGMTYSMSWEAQK